MVYSPPVYTHYQGYKICLRVDTNGSNFGKRTHVSVYVFFMRGEFDDSLKWLFRGAISVQLLDQVKGKDHETYTTPNGSCARVTEGERSTGAWVIKVHCSH